MAQDARIVLQQRLSQQLVMTPQLRQAIKILQVSRAELETLIDQELTENPVLEENADEKLEGAAEVPTVDGQNGADEYAAEAEKPEVEAASTVGEIDWKEYAENYSNDIHGSTGHGSGGDDDDRRAALENVLVKRTLLPDHLMWQLRLSDLSDQEKEVGALIIGSLDKDGYLPLQLEEVAFLADTRPDVYVQKVGDDYVVTLNEEGLPRLRVSSFYRRMLGQNGSPEARGYIQEKMRAAAWLIKSIHQRQRTLYMVTSSIVKFQREFFEGGVAFLRPLVLKDVANDIGMHESTVSRATAGKYVHTPQGTFELKYFFTSSLRGGQGSEVSAESVKEKIREIIAKEDAKKPLSDQYIAEMLGKEQIDIARRTVAKYRELMGILPSSKRKQVY